MIYRILQFFVKFSLHIFYKIDVKGLEKIPSNQPIALAPNHVNGFVDPVILAMFLPQKVRFFARGDVFKGKFVLWLLNKMNVSPMYRMQEGYAEVKKNDKSFEECKQLLGNNKTLLIFPEAICIQDKRMRPLKKGLSRVVFQTAEFMDFSKDILVVPVGLNYAAPTKFRSKVVIDIGEPLSIKQYEARFKEDKVKTINDFTKVLEEKLAERVAIIKSAENDRLVDSIEEVYLQELIHIRNNPQKLSSRYNALREIINKVNSATEKDPYFISSLKENLFLYLEQLKKYELRDHLLRPENINKMNIGSFILEYLIIYLGTPIYLLSLIFNYTPYYLAKKYTENKVKVVEFYASVYVNLAFIFWLIFYVIQLITIGFIFRNFNLLFLYALIIPFLGFYALKFYPIMKKILGRWRLLRMVRKEKNIVEQLINQRGIIIQQLEKLSTHY